MFGELFRHYHRFPQVLRQLPKHFYSTMAITSESIQQKFLSSPHFAVVGASKDRTKYGTRVLNWYEKHFYDVTPVHPKEKELEGLATLSNIGELPNPAQTSISIITPPKVTLGILQKAKELNIPALWLQPGAEDEAVISYINENDLTDRVIYGGPCILVEGEQIASTLESRLLPTTQQPAKIGL